MRKSNNSPIWNKCQLMRAPEGLKELKKSGISNDYEVYATKEFQMEGEEEFQIEGDPTSFEKAMRSVHSSK
jgi:hypothetical protein